MAEMRLTGGCQCGAVRYALKPPLGRASICHCRMCQKAFGAFYAPLVAVPLSAFELTRGAPSIFRSSGAVERGFCRRCGTPLTFRYLPEEKIEVAIGSLDDPALAKPTIQFGIESRISWLGELDGLPGEETEAPGSEERAERTRLTNRQHPDHDTDSWPLTETGR
jgi:hypothetical protein